MNVRTPSPKRFFMTGGTSGLGKAAVVELIKNGYHLIVASRSEEKSDELRAAVEKENGEHQDRLEFISCDLAAMESIVQACESIKEKGILLDGIINNAGVWSFSREKSRNNIEKTLQVNLLAPYLIVRQLKEYLKPGAKLIQTASALHQGKILMDDPEFDRSYSGFRAYRQSKLGIILLTRWWAKVFDTKELTSVSWHPGLVSTELGRDGNWIVRKFFDWFGKSPKEGAQTLLYLVETSPNELENGAYYKNKRPKKTDTSVSQSMEWAEKIDELCRSYTEEFLPQS